MITLSPSSKSFRTETMESGDETQISCWSTVSVSALALEFIAELNSFENEIQESLGLLCLRCHCAQTWIDMIGQGSTRNVLEGMLSPIKNREGILDISESIVASFLETNGRNRCIFWRLFWSTHFKTRVQWQSNCEQLGLWCWHFFWPIHGNKIKQFYSSCREILW